MNKHFGAISDFLKSEDINKFGEGDLPGIIVAIATGNPAEKALAISRTIKDITNLPTYIFWYKMERYLRGTFHCYEDQIKMASRFNSDNDRYSEFVEELIYTVNQIDNNDKIDYFAALTRAFLIAEIEKELFFKLAKYLLLCTYGELQFIKNCHYSFESKNTIKVSALYQFGLFTQVTHESNNETVYILSDFAKALKQNCLNFEENLKDQKRLLSYEELTPLEIGESITSEQLDQLYNNSFRAKDDGNGNITLEIGRQ